jgi:hypothetical protein
MIGALLTPFRNASPSYGWLALAIACNGSACSEDPAQTSGAQSGGPGAVMMPTPPPTGSPKPVTAPMAMPPAPVTAPPGVTPMAPPTAQPPAGGAAAAPIPGMMPGASESNELAGECPEGFMPKEGENTGFPDPSGMRQFVVVPPSAPSPGGMDAPYPLFISLTGTVESTNQNLTNRGNTSKLAEKGWIVVGPVRQCSSNADDASSACNGTGSDGWQWRPWNEGAAAGSGQKWYQEAGPDSEFLKKMTKCIATKWKLDSKRLFVGGISSGGTFSNRLLTFQDDFWAGGLPISGEMYLMNAGAVPNDPTAIQDGRCCPVPLPLEPDAMDPMLIITIWGGPNDTWPGANYLASTQVFSNYMETQKNVVHLACSATHGHMWPTQMQDAFNAWFADVFYSHPKGTAPDAFKMIDPPDSGGAYTCKLGRYTDHYNE